MPGFGAVLVAVLLAAAVAAPVPVSFPTADGGVVHADVSGTGPRGVVLAHGGRFDKSSWRAQAQALAEAGFRSVAIDFRGRGQSRGGPGPGSDEAVHLDVLAAVHYLRQTGAKTVSVVGGSFGGGAAAQASVVSAPGEIDRIVLLAHSAIDEPERMKGRKLFITSRDDPQLERGSPARADPRPIRAGPGPEGAGDPRGLGPRPVHLRDGPGRAADARDPALPDRAVGK